VNFSHIPKFGILGCDIDEVDVVGAGLLEESLKVVYWRLCMALDAAPSGHNALHGRVVRLLAIVVIVTAGGGSGPLRMTLLTLLATLDILHGTLDGAIGDHFPTA
jgi:hypothetical protein